MTIEDGAVTVDSDPWHERGRLLVWWLRGQIDDEEASATASSGYRYLRCGGCSRPGCIFCNSDRPEAVRSRANRSADPRFVAAVLDRIDRFPPEVVANASSAMRRLPPAERTVLLLTEGAGMPFDQAARQLKCSRQTITRLHQGGLTQWARLVWPSQED